MNVIIDFETRSKSAIEVVGAYNYSKHESTKPICMAYKINDGETKIWIESEGHDIPQDLAFALEASATIEGHNVLFEYFIWNNLMVKLYGWPSLDISRFRCTAARAAQFALPRSLEDVAKALNLGIEKDLEGRRIMLQVCKPKKPSKKSPGIWYEDEERYQKLYEYCKRDVDVTYAIRNRLVTLSRLRQSLLDRLDVPNTKELSIFTLNNQINDRGVYCDTDLCKSSMQLITQHEEVLLKRLQAITQGKIQTANQSTAIRDYLHTLGLEIPDIRSKTVDLWLPKAEGLAKEILEIRQALSKSSVKKIKAMLGRAADDNRIRDLLVYYGAARTGRFSGVGIQVQNFKRPSLDPEEITTLIDKIKSGTSYSELIEEYPDFLSAISSCLRGMLKAEGGKIFYDSDFSAIEARVLFWLAEEEIGLESYRQGLDIYKIMAADIHGINVTEVTKDMRMLGKTAILGLGYSMSAKKFGSTCDNFGMKVPPELAEKAVETYRDKYSKVVELWRKVEKAAVAAIKNPSKVFTVHDKMHFCMLSDFMFVVLPSGRALAYHRPKLTVTPWGKPNIEYMGFSSQIKKYESTKTYGGKLVENIVQATARDFMTEAMLRAEAAGYKMVFTVHDQLVAEVPKDFGSVEEFTSIMTELPSWGEGCPIDAETKICERFEK